MKKKTVHILLAISLSLLAVGALFSIIGFSLGGSPEIYIDTKGIHVGALDPMVEDTPTISTFEKLVLDLSFTDVEVIQSNEFKLEITGRGTKKPIITLENGVLSVHNNSKQNGFYFFTFGTGNVENSVKLYVPSDFVFKDVTITSEFGNISFKDTLVEDFAYNGTFGDLTYRGSITKSLKSTINFGDTSFTGHFLGKIDLSSHFGDIDFETDVKEIDYNYTIKTSFGEVLWNHENFSNKKQDNHASNDIKMNSNFGDITVSTK